MNSDGTSTFASARCAVSSQLRSRLRYQLTPPVKPGAGELGGVVVELVLAEPVGQAVRLGHPLDEPRGAGGEHAGHGLGPRVLVAGGRQPHSIRRIVVAGSRSRSTSATPGSWK